MKKGTSKRKNKKDFKKRVIVLAIIGAMGLSTIGGIAGTMMYSNKPNVSAKEQVKNYLESTNKAIDNAKPIPYDKVKELVKFNENKDYTLKTALSTLGTPCYIMKDKDVISKEEDINKELNRIKNKEYEANDFIELGWKTNNNYIVTTYIATDIKSNANIIGIFTSNKSFNINDTASNKDILSTNAKFEDFKLGESISEIETKNGKLYPINYQYPLNIESSNVKSSFADLESATKTNSTKVIKTSNGLIVLTSNGDSLISKKLMINDNLELKELSNEKFDKIKNEKELQESEFKQQYPEAICIAEKYIYTEGTKGLEKHLSIGYLLKSKNGQELNINFKDGKLVK